MHRTGIFLHICTMKKLRIVFMGTPEFATASLERIIDTGYKVAGVVTSPDKPAGRGRKVSESPVKKLAQSHDLKVLQPTNLKSPEFIEKFRALKANLGVVVAFRMLPEVIWSMPEYGTFNLHASLLPDYRGAAPIQHVIMNGEKETGVTTFFLRNEIDTGDVILRKKVEIGDSETAGDLHDKLMVTGAELVAGTLSAIGSDNLRLKKQSDLIDTGQTLHVAPKIYKDDCRIDWNNPGVKVYNKIRALSPSPGAFTHLIKPDGKSHKVKIYKSKYKKSDSKCNPGKISITQKNEFLIDCSDGKISIIEIQLEGKKRIGAKDFLNGFPISDDWFSK